MIGQVNNMTLSFFLLTLALSTPVTKTHGSSEKVNPNLYDGVSPLEFLNGHLGKIGVLKHSPEYFALLSKTVEDLHGIIEDAGSEINEVRGEIDNLVDEIVQDLPDEIEDFDDMINGTIDITKTEDSGSEINDVRDEIDYLVDEIVKDLPDEIVDFDDMINEAIDITNESIDEASSRGMEPSGRFMKDPSGSEDHEDDEESEAKSRTKRFALFDPLRYLRREVMKNRVRPNIPYIFMSQGRPGFDSRGAVRVETGADPRAVNYGRTGVGYPRRPRFKK